MSAIIDNDVYDRESNQWHNPEHFLNLLQTTVQPVRFGYLQRLLENEGMPHSRRMNALDIGCGGGFMSEALAQLNFNVVGMDPSSKTLLHAKQHAQQARLNIEFELGKAEALPFDDAKFDLVCACDVLEHIDDLPQAISEASRVLRPGGIFFYDTINRTLISRVAAIEIAQNFPLTAFMGKHVHVWDKFIKPTELQELLYRNGLNPMSPIGIMPEDHPLIVLINLIRYKFSRQKTVPLSRYMKLALSEDISIHYMSHAIKKSPLLSGTEEPT